ncbi:transmembrane protein 91-like isoform X2 [Branchiostoma lanceolatum]|uniref:transmembrane protein 91-like isoform X1 n=1 Tax=Branchiostoma lanceolatum TaxID=7740 RepID=UPI0034519740
MEQNLWPGNMQQQTVVVGSPQDAADARPNNHLVMAVATAICCCWPVGIAAVYYALQVDPRWEKGDRKGAKSASKTAEFLYKLAACLLIAGVLIIPIVFFFTRLA